jgi:hypothetical protein
MKVSERLRFPHENTAAIYANKLDRAPELFLMTRRRLFERASTHANAISQNRMRENQDTLIGIETDRSRVAWFRSPHDDPAAVKMRAPERPHWREGKASKRTTGHKRQPAMSAERSALLILALPGHGKNRMLASNKDAGTHPGREGKQS